MIKKYATPLLLALAFLVLVAGLLPGGASPARALKLVADRFVADGDFETINAAFYNRLRPVLLAAGAWLAAVGLLFRRARQTGDRRWLRWTAAAAGAGVLGLLLFTIALGAQGLRSPVYQYLAGTPLAVTATPSPTPAPPTIVPSPTAVPLGPGRWEPVATGFEQPVVFAEPGDGSGRLFIGDRRGRIWVLAGGRLLPEPFLDLRDRVIQEFESLEQGLLGLAFHPDFAENGFLYVDYTDRQGNTVVSRFSIHPDSPDRADPDSESRLFGIIQPAEIHNGGHLAFGPDGYLYIGSGDGGPQGDPYGTAQSLDVLLGKLLRIDVDTGNPYGIPAGNPFAAAAGLDEIYAIGLRNPWRFSFDALTDDLYIGDVGHDDSEEIDFIPAGTPPGFNLGWSNYEGFDFYPQHLYPPVEGLPDHLPPAWVYSHGGGGRCAVVGGFVYRGAALPELDGVYIYGDYCSGDIWGLQRGPGREWVNEFLYDTEFTISSFGVDSAGELYLLSLKGEVHRLVP